jgi:hypothetical protein
VKAEKKNERNMNKQERRGQERLTRPTQYIPTIQKEPEMKYDLLQPWSVPIMRTTLPPHVLQTMIEISDQVIADKEAKTATEIVDEGPSHPTLLFIGGHNTSTQDLNILKQTGVMDFFLGAIRQFVFQCKCQMFPQVLQTREEWLTQIVSMWIVSQQPGEYVPMHIHNERYYPDIWLQDHCTISAVMYLKVPKMLPSRQEAFASTGKFNMDKEHRSTADGSILFCSNASRDVDFSNPNIAFRPAVGDFYIFGAQQQHSVYPYRCEEGDSERRSISFNAVFQSKTEYDNETKK